VVAQTQRRIILNELPYLILPHFEIVHEIIGNFYEVIISFDHVRPVVFEAAPIGTELSGLPLGREFSFANCAFHGCGPR
jgi:hypothetical protein